MKKLLVTGASGFLGRHICSMATMQWNVIGIVHSHPIKLPDVNIIRLDLTNYKELKKIFLDIVPDAVIHAAASSKPDFCQIHQNESYKINVDASVNIAKLCAERNIPLVFTSSDFVFDGLNPPYTEKDPVCPINIYGEQKVNAEEKIIKNYPKAAICRMSFIFGLSEIDTSGFVLPLIKAMQEKKCIKLCKDEIRSPISVTSAVSGIFQILEKAHGIIHLAGNESISKYNFGKLLAQIFQLHDAKIEPCTLNDLSAIANRPPDLTLENTKAIQSGFIPSSLKSELYAIKNIL